MKMFDNLRQARRTKMFKRKGQFDVNETHFSAQESILLSSGKSTNIPNHTIKVVHL